VLLALLAALAAGIYAKSSIGAQPALLVGPPALFALVLLLAWAFAPRGFAIGRAFVRIERVLFPIELPLREVREAGMLPAEHLCGTVRVLGTSGAFGHYGRFRSRSLGDFRMYATRCQDLVRLVTDRGTFVLSPDPVERFVGEVLALAPSARRSDVTGPAPLPKRPSRAVWLVPLAIVATLLLAVAAVWIGVDAWAPRLVEVRGNAVVVERRHASPVAIPLESVREIRVLTRDDFRGWRRTGGASAGEIAYGRFRSEALGDFQLYAWRHGAHVLLETDGGKVVLTPDDPSAFLAEVRSRLGR
jgi:hypothetical protein